MFRLVSITSILLVACASQGDEGMTVLNNTAIGETCSLTGDKMQQFTSHGVIHAGSPFGYTMTPLIESRIALGVEGEVVDPLQKTIFLRGADIRLTLKAVSIESNGNFTVTQPDQLVSEAGVLFSGSVPPAGTVNVGFDAISPATLRQIAGMAGAPAGAAFNAEVLAEVTIRGDLGGNEVTSNAFHYPISVCNDCIVVNNGACPMTISSPRLGNACNPFQDGIVDCCQDADGRLVCPGPTM